MVVTRGQEDESKIVGTPLTQMTKTGKEDAPLMPINESMIPGGLPIENRRDHHTSDHYQQGEWDNCRSYSSRPATEDEN